MGYFAFYWISYARTCLRLVGDFAYFVLWLISIRVYNISLTTSISCHMLVGIFSWLISIHVFNILIDYLHILSYARWNIFVVTRWVILLCWIRGKCCGTSCADEISQICSLLLFWVAIRLYIWWDSWDNSFVGWSMPKFSVCYSCWKIAISTSIIKCETNTSRHWILL